MPTCQRPLAARSRRLPVDSALLIPAVRDALAAEDPRSVATLEAVVADLSQEHFVYRFRHDQQPLAETEGAFLLCGFFMSLAQAQLGNHAEAARWFERNRSATGPSGLFAEKFDVVQRQLRGNRPQAFAHAALIEAGRRLATDA